MHIDFFRAIAHGEDLDEVYSRLCHIENDFRTKNIESYQADLRNARMIVEGLKEPKDSFTFKFSAQYLKDAKAAEEQKPDAVKAYELRRQQIEESYTKALEEQTELIRKENDARRDRIRSMEIERRSHRQ